MFSWNPSHFDRSNYTDQNNGQGDRNKPGVCGLKNMGNTCYMNSALQCLSNIKILTEFCEISKQKSESCAKEGRIYLITLYFRLIEQMWQGYLKSLEPLSFRSKIRQLFPQFDNCQQNDCTEFMTSILNTFHEELKEIEGQFGDDFTEYKTFAEYLKNNNTFIARNFQGFQKFSLSCAECGTTLTESYDPFYVITLPEIEGQTRTDITVTLIKEDSEVFQIELTFSETEISVENLLRKLFIEFGNKTQQVLFGNKVIVTQVYDHTIEKVLEKDEKLCDLSANRSIYVYECNQSVEWHIFVNLRDDHSYGFPILLDLNDCSYEQIYNSFVNSFQKRLNFSKKLQFISCYIIFLGFNGLEDFELDHTGKLSDFTQNQNQILRTLGMWDSFRNWYRAPIPRYLNCSQDYYPGHKRKTTTVKLEDCLQKYLSPKSMDEFNKIMCEKCNKECKANEKFNLINGPRILMFQLKSNPQNHDMHRNYQCIYPRTFNLGPYLTNENQIEGEFTYELNAVSNAQRFASSVGHYTTYAHNFKDNKWYEFNDESVNKIFNESKLISKDAYLIIYSRIK